MLYDGDKEIQVTEEQVLQAEEIYQLLYTRDDSERDTVGHDLIDISLKN